MLVAVTGAGGFIGKEICRVLQTSCHDVRRIFRTVEPRIESNDKCFRVVGEISASTDWSTALRNVSCVIHCAARVHVARETEKSPLGAYRLVNVEGTRRLAEQSAALGVRRLVFLSSIGVLGSSTAQGRKFSPFDAASPADDYSISKWEAEQTLWDVSASTGLEVVVVRPPAVYGPDVKGNLARLLGLLRLGLPLPLGAVKNKLSFIGLDNLVDLLVLCVDSPSAAGRTFLASDGEDLSTPDLLRNMAAAMGHSAKLFPVPVSLLRLTGHALGKKAEINRLVGSLQIDSGYTREVLGWKPSVSVEEGLWRMVAGS